MALSLSQEFLLVAACSRWPPSERRSEAIREAARGPLDWDRFLRVAIRHQVVGLVHDGLTRARPAVPPGIIQVIGAQAVELVRQNLVLAAEGVRLQRLFAEANVPVLFIKGTPLAMLAYGNLGLRQSKDLDLLVPAHSVPTAIALVERAGYCRFDPPAGISNAQLRLLTSMRRDFGFIHEESQVVIELHWRLFGNPHFIAETSLITSSRIVPLMGAIEMRTLADEDLFPYLCAHGALHWWYQLKWLADIGALLAGTSSDGVERLYAAAEARGGGRAAALALLLCQRLLRTSVPDHLVTTLRETATLRWLEATALKAMTAGNSEIEPREILFGTTRGNLSCFLLNRGWRYWLAELKNHATCETDVLTLLLPQQLQFLYPILRLPLWLWRHSSQRIRSLR
jgi:Uncharacterised nucleotidyltransferase